MRYFLDTEYNGFGGALLSLALVPEDGGEEFYVTLECDAPARSLGRAPRHPLPRHGARRAEESRACRAAPRPKRSPPGWRMTRRLTSSPTGPRIWRNCRCCWSPGPGMMVPVPPLSLHLVPLHGFSTAANSVVPAQCAARCPGAARSYHEPFGIAAIIRATARIHGSLFVRRSRISCQPRRRAVTGRPKQALLVADLHLEKASWFAAARPVAAAL